MYPCWQHMSHTVISWGWSKHSEAEAWCIQSHQRVWWDLKWWSCSRWLAHRAVRFLCDALIPLVLSNAMKLIFLTLAAFFTGSSDLDLRNKCIFMWLNIFPFVPHKIPPDMGNRMEISWKTQVTLQSFFGCHRIPLSLGTHVFTSMFRLAWHINTIYYYYEYCYYLLLFYD